ncbi:MAG: hypothetical protein ACRCYD_01845 [Plesiomonas sp.]
MVKEKFAEPLRDYIKRTSSNQVKFAILEGMTEQGVTKAIQRGDVVIDGVRYICTGKELKGGK